MIWTIIGVVCFGVLAVIGAMQSARWRVSRPVADRMRLSEVAFAERFFPAEQRETARKIRRLLAPYIPVNANRIQPSDLLVDDLGLAAGHLRDLDMISLVQALEKEFKVESSDDDDLQMQTLQDAVEMVLKKTRKT